MTVPVFTVEAAFGYTPGDESPSWTDISDYVRTIQYQRGRQHETDRPEAGSARLVLRDETRAFDPDYTSSPFYPDVVPLVPIRCLATINGNTYPLFRHFVERWPRERHGPNYAERAIVTVDGFAILAAATVTPEFATLTTALSGTHNDLLFTAKTPGTNGNQVTIRYVVTTSYGSGVSESVIDNDIEVRVNGTSHTASDVLAAVEANPQAAALVGVELAPGNDGTGVVTAMTTTSLSGGVGGTFPQELSGARVTRILDKALWPDALRVIGTGKSTLPAITFAESDASSLLAHLLNVDGTEDGLTFCDGEGQLVFVDRQALITTPYTVSQATFGDADRSTGDEYVDIVPSDDIDLLFNEFTGSRNGGVTHTVSDEDSQTAFLRRATSVSILAVDDQDVIDALTYKLLRYKDPVRRVDSVEITPKGTASEMTAMWETLFALELGDRLTILENPPPEGSGETSGEYHIQSLDVRIPIGAVGARFSYGLWPADLNNWLILDHASRGQLDSNQLAR